MPVPAPNLYPDFNTIRLSHACLNVRDLNASKKFYTDILGLQITDENDSAVYLRAMEGRGQHCLKLHKSDEPGTVEDMTFTNVNGPRMHHIAGLSTVPILLALNQKTCNLPPVQ